VSEKFKTYRDKIVNIHKQSEELVFGKEKAPAIGRS